jgi:hypothetical protein
MDYCEERSLTTAISEKRAILFRENSDPNHDSKMKSWVPREIGHGIQRVDTKDKKELFVASEIIKAEDAKALSQILRSRNQVHHDQVRKVSSDHSYGGRSVTVYTHPKLESPSLIPWKRTLELATFYGSVFYDTYYGNEELQKQLNNIKTKRAKWIALKNKGFVFNPSKKILKHVDAKEWMAVKKRNDRSAKLRVKSSVKVTYSAANMLHYGVLRAFRSGYGSEFTDWTFFHGMSGTRGTWDTLRQAYNMSKFLKRLTGRNMWRPYLKDAMDANHYAFLHVLDTPDKSRCSLKLEIKKEIAIWLSYEVEAYLRKYKGKKARESWDDHHKRRQKIKSKGKDGNS